MRILDFSSAAARPLTAFGSHDVLFTPITRPVSAGAVCMRIQPGGVVAAHPARANQLFLVVEGEGWVRSGADAPVALEAGRAAFWEAGEVHESGSASGLVAIVIEGQEVEPLLPAI